MLLVESIWICKWHHQPAELHSYTAHSLAHSDCTLQNNFLEQQLGCKKFLKKVIHDNSTSKKVCAFRCVSSMFNRKLRVHSMATANLNKTEDFVTNTTTASKVIPRRPKISINWNPPFQTSLHKISKEVF